MSVPAPQLTPDFAPLRFVPFAPEDEAGVIALIGLCYAGYGQVMELDTLDADLHRIPAAYPPPGSAFRVLKDPAGRVVGTVAVKDEGGGEGQLKRVFLHPEHRGRGHGRRLCEWAFAHAAAAGIRLLHIWSDVKYDTAHHLYRALGCADTRRQRKLGGINDVDEFYFTKELSPAPGPLPRPRSAPCSSPRRPGPDRR